MARMIKDRNHTASSRADSGAASLEAVGMVAASGLVVVLLLTMIGGPSNALAGLYCRATGAMAQAAGGEPPTCAPDSSVAPPPSGEPPGAQPPDDRDRPRDRRPDGNSPPMDPPKVVPPRSPVCRPAEGSTRPGLPPGEVKLTPKPARRGPIKDSTSITVKIDPAKVEGDATNSQKMSIVLEGQRGVSAEKAAELGKVGVKLDFNTGRRTTYGYSGPTDSTPNLTDGIPPNPFDPDNIPPGGTVNLDGEFYTSVGATAAYRGLVANETDGSGSGATVAVTKLPPSKPGENKVRVMVGSTDFVEQAVSLGFGTPSYNLGLFDSRKVTDKAMRQAEFDLGTPEGRRAYNAAVFGGKLPTSDEPGVSNIAQVMGSEYARRNGVQVKAGDQGAKSTTDGEDHSVLVTVYSDGRQVDEVTRRVGPDTYSQVQEYDASGARVPEKSRFQFRQTGLSADEVENYNFAYGDDRAEIPPGSYNAVLSLNAGELQQVRIDAATILAASLKKRGIDRPELGSNPRLADFQRVLKDNPRWLDETFNEPAEAEALRILRYPNDAELANMIWRSGGWTETSNLDWFNQWRNYYIKVTGDDLPTKVGDMVCRRQQ